MESCRFLRPRLQRAVKPAARSSYVRFFTVATKLCAQNAENKRNVQDKARSEQSDYGKRISQLEKYSRMDKCYPRIGHAPAGRVSIRTLRETAAGLQPDESRLEEIQIIGRVTSARFAGSKLVFLTVVQEGHSAQVVVNRGFLQENEENLSSQWPAFRHMVRRGDWYSFNGFAHKTKTGELSLLASGVPVLQAPSLHQVPQKLDDAEAKSRKPHVAMLVDRKELQTLQVRSHIETWIANHLQEKGFLKVSTPLLTAGAGGAVARPFETVATELADTKLNLRVAPELWLKRLVIGGMGKVYEMGPAFRNEGVDATHNPEFTICEFYMQFAEIESLMTMTEDLLQGLHAAIMKHSTAQSADLDQSILSDEHSSLFTGSFQRLPFIPTLEREMNRKLPNLDSSNALGSLESLFNDLNLPLPSNATVPRLLDALCGHYIEPLCQAPTFITHHPEALSPLSKSFLCPETNQLVSARAELFIRGHEYANMYEEENSPFEQRRKFEEQLAHRKVDGEGDGRLEVDESYLEALEWGLPPTGGWGMGIDRLVMLFTGRKRIGDVLPFGTLRNVVGLATRRK